MAPCSWRRPPLRILTASRRRDVRRKRRDSSTRPRLPARLNRNSQGRRPPPPSLVRLSPLPCSNAPPRRRRNRRAVPRCTNAAVRRLRLRRPRLPLCSASSSLRPCSVRRRLRCSRRRPCGRKPRRHPRHSLRPGKRQVGRFRPQPRSTAVRRPAQVAGRASRPMSREPRSNGRSRPRRCSRSAAVRRPQPANSRRAQDRRFAAPIPQW